MICHPEATYAVYVDGELDDEERRSVDAHLVSCLRCRSLVVSLREEAELVAEALRAPLAPESVEADAPRRKGRGFAAAPAAAAALVATLGLGWLLESLLPRSSAWLSVGSLRAATTMALDLVFLLRDKAPAAFEVIVATSAMASASALLTFALTALLRRRSGGGLLMLGAPLALLAYPTPGHAHFGLHDHRDFALEAGETHDGTLFASGDVVRVDGVVEGDLLVLSERLTIDGEVRGNVIAVARSVVLNGRVTGSAHLLTSDAQVGGELGGNLYGVGAERLELAGPARIAGDLLGAGEQLVLAGRVGRDVFAAADRLELRGEVVRNVQARANGLTLLEGAHVGGDVQATLYDDAEVEAVAGARVDGEIRSQRATHHEPGFERFLEPGFYLLMALHVAAGFVFGMLLHALLPGLFGGSIDTPRRLLHTLGLGTLALLATPIAAAIAAVTIIGLPVAVAGLCLYVVALYAALIVSSALVGSALVSPRGAGAMAFGLPLLAGLAALALITHTPFVGDAVRVIAVLAGLGLMVERVRAGFGRRRLAIG